MLCFCSFNPDSKMARKWENAMTLDKRSWGYRRNGKLHEYYSIKVKLYASICSVNYCISLNQNSLNQDLNMLFSEFFIGFD